VKGDDEPHRREGDGEQTWMSGGCAHEATAPETSRVAPVRRYSAQPIAN
jgi:hypothetical protein